MEQLSTRVVGLVDLLHQQSDTQSSNTAAVGFARESRILRSPGESFRLFTELWLSGRLKGTLAGFSAFKQRLNRRLADLLNVRLTSDYGNPPNDKTPRANDIVEVLAINRHGETGPSATTAILTSRDGVSSTLAPKHTSQLPTSSLARNRLVKYNLDCINQSSDIHRGETPTFSVQLAPDFAHSIKKALFFPEEQYRQYEIKDAHRRTFGWTLRATSSPLFLWLSGSDHLFWLNGKAGSGKSTLMKYLWENPSLSSILRQWAGHRSLLCCAFFFWHAGTHLQKSHTGILRSLMRQVLEERPDLAPTLFPSITRAFLL